MKTREKLKSDNRKKLENGVTFFFVLCFVFFLSFSFFSMKFPVLSVVRLIAFLVFGLFLPGYLLSRKIADKRNSSELYALSMLFGIAWSVAFYFLDSLICARLFGKIIFSVLGGPVMSVPALYLLISDIKNGDRTKESFKIRKGFLLLLLLTTSVAFCCISLRSGVSAQRVGLVEGYHDIYWNIGNTSALDLGWPTDNLYYLGKRLNSNILANIFRVAVSRFVGTSAADTMFICSPLIMVPFLVFSLDTLALRFFSGKKRTATIFVFTFVFIGYLSRAVLGFYDVRLMNKLSASLANVVIGVNNLLFAPNGIDVAVPSCALLVALIGKIFNDKKNAKADLFAVLVASFVVSGAKYVFAICVIGTLVALFVFMLIQKRPLQSFKTVFLILVVAGIGFVISYRGIVSGNAVYKPATGGLAAEYYGSNENGYVEASQNYLRFLDQKNYEYIVVGNVSPEDEIAVREKGTGVYYIGGGKLSATALSENDAFELMAGGTIDNSGIIGGAGGTFSNALAHYGSISNAVGFVRVTLPDGAGTKFVFFGTKRPAYRSADSEDALYSTLFVPGGNGTGYSYVAEYSSITINATAKKSEVYKWMMSSMPTEHSNIYLLFFVPIMFFICRPVTSIPFLIWVVQKLKKIKEVDLFEMLAAGIAICGSLVYFVLEVDGSSQVYFFITGLIFVDLIGIKWISEHYSGFRLFEKALLVILAVNGIFSYVGIYGYYAARGVKRLQLVYSHEYEDALPDQDYITSFEYEAMEWLRQNTPANAIIAVNRQNKATDQVATERPIPNDTSRFYTYSAYAERLTFLGGWAYSPRTQQMQTMLQERLAVNNALFNPLCKNRRALMENNGIDYLVASNYVGTGMYLEDPDLECVFRNRDIAIYALKK